MSHNLGLNNKSKFATSKIHGANFLQKRFNQLPSLFSGHVERGDDDDDQIPFSSSGTAKKEKFRIRNFLSVSTHTHDVTEERVKRRLQHQNFSLNSATKANSPVPIVEPVKNYKSTLKECLSQKNVRRKSSTLNTSCVNFANPCNKTSPLSLKSSHLDLSLIQKAARRGSIHFYDNKKKKCQQTDTFREKLLKLQRQQLEFLESNTQLAYHDANRRKLAFAINEEFESDDNRELVAPRLSHAISSLSLIVNDEDNASGDKLINQNRVSLTNSLTDVNEELINEKNNEIGRVTKWATGFERLLEDPLGLQIFTEFLKKEFSEENIDFWVKCENFKKLNDLEEMKIEASNIWQTYLDTSSMCQINVDNKARSSCQEALQSPNNTMFELAQTQIFTLMKYDSYSRFLKSQMYKDCIVNEMEGKPIYSALNSKPKKPEALSNVNNPSNNDNSEVVEENQTNSSSIPNASSNLATAVAVVASTGAALITNVTVSNSPQVNDSLSNSNLTVTSNSNSGSSFANDPNRKEKKKSTIIPWTKAFIKWKRLSGKEKKSQVSNTESQQPTGSIQSQNLTLTSGVAATLGKTITPKTPLSGIPETTNGISQIVLDQVTSPTVLSPQIESKFCRVLCSNDGSSSMIQPLPGQTVYQAMNKVFSKKNIPWYKSDLYFVGDYTPIDQNMDAQVLCSKEICLIERCLFVLSLTPIAINLCVKANMKKSIISILQPILDFYQIKANNCGIFLNSGSCVLNVNDTCSSIDSQHILVVHKQQTTFFSQTEIDKLIKVSIDDFIPINMNDFQLQFDELGILKQFKKNNSISPIMSPTSPKQTSINSLSTSTLLSSGFRLVKQDDDDPEF